MAENSARAFNLARRIIPDRAGHYFMEAMNEIRECALNQWTFFRSRPENEQEAFVASLEVWKREQEYFFAPALLNQIGWWHVRC